MRNLFSGIGGTSPGLIEQNTSSSFSTCFCTTLISLGKSLLIISCSFSLSASDSDEEDSGDEEDDEDPDEDPDELSEDDDELDLDEFDETDDLLFSTEKNRV